MVTSAAMIRLLLVLLLVVASSLGDQSDIRARVSVLSDSGLQADLLAYLLEIEQLYGTLDIDDQYPSLYSYKGVALYSDLKVDDAEEAFKEAIRRFPKDARAWINLGEVQVQTFKLNEAVESFTGAYMVDHNPAIMTNILRTKAWCANWKDFESHASIIEHIAEECLTEGLCRTDSTGGFEYTTAGGVAMRVAGTRCAYSQPSKNLVTGVVDISAWDNILNHPRASIAQAKRPRLKIGLVSSDFGVHPVSNLVRGLVQFLDKSRVELFCFGLHSKVSWWGLNITETADHILWLHQMNTFDAAKAIAATGVEILIDLNGHTMHSGLPIFAHRPCLVQMTFLGLPTTTSSPFVDYFLGDHVVIPAENSEHYSERLLLLPPCYIVNDFAQLVGDVATKHDRPSTHAPVSTWNFISPSPGGTVDRDRMLAGVKQASLLFATLSNSAKLDPDTYAVWMNILRVHSSARMLFIKYMGFHVSMPHMVASARYHGVRGEQLVSVDQTPWLDHLYVKTNLDLVLDSRVKSGHTTGLDAAWAGVPTVSFAGGPTSEARAGESIARALQSEYGLAHSLKEYEDVVLGLSRRDATQFDRPCLPHSRGGRLGVERCTTQRLGVWKHFAGKRRLTSGLFDTRQWTGRFTHMMEATWELALLTRFNASAFHVFAVATENKAPRQPFPTGQMTSDQSMIFTPPANSLEGEVGTSGAVDGISRECGFDCPIPPMVFDGRNIMLNIGGISPNKGWLTVNSQVRTLDSQQVGADIVRHMHKLTGFPNSSVTAVYSSHTLEHNGFGDGMVSATLAEWFRVLKPGGLVFVSVPDLEVLARLYLGANSTQDRWFITRMMFGAQSDEFDFHKVGFDFGVLKHFLQQAGFCQVERLQHFNLGFGDTSELVSFGNYISLNVVAKVCIKKRPDGSVDPNMIEIAHNGSPFVKSEAEPGHVQ